jgi:hypothetical protein
VAKAKKKKKVAKKAVKKVIAKKTSAKSTKKKSSKKKRDWSDFHVTPRVTTEEALTGHLDEDLREAWAELRAFASSLGEQRIYASHNSIMFAKSVCYAFVRPKKSYIELVIFLKREAHEGDFKVRPVSRTKFSHTFKLIHRDQVEGSLTDAVREAFESTPD